MDGRAAPVAVATDPVAAPHRPIACDSSGGCDGRRPHVHRPLHVSDSNACRQPDYRSGVRGSRRAVESVRPAPRFLHCAAIWFALGRSTAGQRLASSRRPLRWPPSRPPSTYAAARHLPKSVLFRRSRHRDPTSQQPALGDPQCRCARGSDAPCGRKPGPNSLSVSALRRRRSPSPVGVLAGSRGLESEKGHGGDNVQSRRCPSPRTPRCPQPFAVSPTRPALLRVRSGSAFGSAHKGGATPPAVENVDASLVDVCPLRGRRSPLAAIRTR